jgi:hypothetical protein
VSGHLPTRPRRESHDRLGQLHRFAAGFQLEARKPALPPLGARVRRWLRRITGRMVRLIAGSRAG